jgi:hypothetical protein
MLKCERTTLPPLAPGDYERALSGVIHDYSEVLYHVLMDSGHWYPSWGQQHMAILVDCATRRVFPPLEVLARIIGWVCFTLDWHAKYRELTDQERAIRDAAWRISDALHGPRYH